MGVVQKVEEYCLNPDSTSCNAAPLKRQYFVQHPAAQRLKTKIRWWGGLVKMVGVVFSRIKSYSQFVKQLVGAQSVTQLQPSQQLRNTHLIPHSESCYDPRESILPVPCILFPFCHVFAEMHCLLSDQKEAIQWIECEVPVCLALEDGLPVYEKDRNSVGS